jgi:hypothetical protein
MIFCLANYAQFLVPGSVTVTLKRGAYVTIHGKKDGQTDKGGTGLSASRSNLKSHVKPHHDEGGSSFMRS